jgi:hypothetical protein
MIGAGALVIAVFIVGRLNPSSAIDASPTQSPGASQIAVASPSASAVASVVPVVLASAACGGYHLIVVNTGSGDVELLLNGRTITTVAAGHTVDVAEFGQLDAPPRPWDVVIRTSADHHILDQRQIAAEGAGGGLTVTVNADGLAGTGPGGC